MWEYDTNMYNIYILKMASKLPTPEIRSEGVGSVTNLGPESRDSVIAIIESALQSYLGSDYTITVIDVSDDKFSQTRERRIGIMYSADTGARVMPNQTGTSLMYNTASTVPFFARLFLCTQNGTDNTRFLYAWNIQVAGEWRWFMGAPFLIRPRLRDDPVQFSSRGINSELRGPHPVKVIENTLGSMGFDEPMFVWTRSSTDDNNFQILNPMQEGTQQHTWYWAAQGTGTDPVVTLIGIQDLGGRFDFEQN